MSATKLVDVIEIVENNNDYILLEVIGDKKQCILTGVLNGNEEYIRVSKGKNHILTIYFKDGRNFFSYSFGEGGYTLISDNEERRKRAIVNCIKRELETSITKTDVAEKDLIQKKAEAKGKKVIFEIMDSKSSACGGRYCIHKNHEHYTLTNEDFMKEIEEDYTDIIEVDNYIAQTGVSVTVIEAVRK